MAKARKKASKRRSKAKKNPVIDYGEGWSPSKGGRWAKQASRAEIEERLALVRAEIESPSSDDEMYRIYLYGDEGTLERALKKLPHPLRQEPEAASGEFEANPKRRSKARKNPDYRGFDEWTVRTVYGMLTAAQQVALDVAYQDTMDYGGDAAIVINNTRTANSLRKTALATGPNEWRQYRLTALGMATGEYSADVRKAARDANPKRRKKASKRRSKARKNPALVSAKELGYFYEDGIRDFNGSALVGQNLSGMDLRGAQFRDANLYNVNFSGADLRGADFRGADLGDTDFRGAKVDTDTLLEGVNIKGSKGPPQYYRGDMKITPQEMLGHASGDAGVAPFGVEQTPDGFMVVDARSGITGNIKPEKFDSAVEAIDRASVLNRDAQGVPGGSSGEDYAHAVRTAKARIKKVEASEPTIGGRPLHEVMALLDVIVEDFRGSRDSAVHDYTAVEPSESPLYIFGGLHFVDSDKAQEFSYRLAALGLRLAFLDDGKDPKGLITIYAEDSDEWYRFLGEYNEAYKELREARASNPGKPGKRRSARKASKAKAKKPQPKLLLDISQHLWETYDGKPLKRNLVNFGVHTTVMKDARSAKVRTEGLRAHRAYKREMKLQGWKEPKIVTRTSEEFQDDILTAKPKWGGKVIKIDANLSYHIKEFGKGAWKVDVKEGDKWYALAGPGGSSGWAKTKAAAEKLARADAKKTIKRNPALTAAKKKKLRDQVWKWSQENFDKIPTSSKMTKRKVTTLLNDLEKSVPGVKADGNMGWLIAAQLFEDENLRGLVLPAVDRAEPKKKAEKKASKRKAKKNPGVSDAVVEAKAERYRDHLETVRGDEVAMGMWPQIMAARHEICSFARDWSKWRGNYGEYYAGWSQDNFQYYDTLLPTIEELRVWHRRQINPYVTHPKTGEEVWVDEEEVEKLEPAETAGLTGSLPEKEAGLWPMRSKQWPGRYHSWKTKRRGRQNPYVTHPKTGEQVWVDEKKVTRVESEGRLGGGDMGQEFPFGSFSEGLDDTASLAGSRVRAVPKRKVGRWPMKPPKAKGNPKKAAGKRVTKKAVREALAKSSSPWEWVQEKPGRILASKGKRTVELRKWFKGPLDKGWVVSVFENGKLVDEYWRAPSIMDAIKKGDETIKKGAKALGPPKAKKKAKKKIPGA